ncbi:MAG: hypothetical protein WDO16_03420 [Bacteroidota bacterium]
MMNLGSLSISLNKMADSLDRSFNELANNEWLQTGSAKLSEKIAGEKDIPVLAGDIIRFIAEYTSSEVGAVYLSDDGESFIPRRYLWLIG